MGDIYDARHGRGSLVGMALVSAFDGRGRLLLLAGEAGIGKTRLAEQAQGRSEGGAGRNQRTP